MAQELAPIFGNGSDGALNITSSQAQVLIESSCSGASGQKDLTVGAGLGFVAGQVVMVHKSRGVTTTTAGTWELNKVASYSGTTLTLVLNLENTYNDSGNDQSQVLVLKQYSNVSIGPTQDITYYPKAWDGNTGGILAFLCSGHTLIQGTVTAGLRGYIGGNTNVGDSQQGEGTLGEGINGTSSIGNGGGGGQGHSNGGGGGGGGANITGGSNGGTHSSGGGTGGAIGLEAGNAELTIMPFGGAGGAGGGDNGPAGNGDGGHGGGIVMIFAKIIVSTGDISCGGGTGQSSAEDHIGGGGGGAGGCILLKAQSITADSSSIRAVGAAGGIGCVSAHNSNGSAGNDGRIRLESCTAPDVGTTSPTASQSVGGKSYCGSAVQIL